MSTDRQLIDGTGFGRSFSPERHPFLSAGVWATLRAANGDGYDTAGYIRLESWGSSNEWDRMSRFSIRFDAGEFLPDDEMWRVTQAELEYYLTSKSNSGGIWSDANAGLVLVSTDESVLAAQDQTQEAYEAIIAGNTVYSNSIAYSSMTAPGLNDFAFNSTGLAYWNTLHTKTLYPGYLYFGLIFVGDQSNTTPTWPGDPYDIRYFGNHSTSYINFTYETPIKANIGNVWKECPQVKVNIGDVWKDVNVDGGESQANIGDVWKDL